MNLLYWLVSFVGKLLLLLTYSYLHIEDYVQILAKKWWKIECVYMLLEYWSEDETEFV